VPLVGIAVLSYAAGLLAGFGDHVALAGAIGLLVAITATLHRTATFVGAGVAITAGSLVAGATALSDTRCARDFGRESTHTVILDAAGEPGAFVHARDLRCSNTFVSLAIEHGRAPAGSVVNVRGLTLSAQRGFLVQRATIRWLTGPGLRARWRTRATAAVDRVFSADAALARALLVADMSTLSPEIRDRYAAAGLAHMLSISGLHVGIIAVALETLFQLLRLGRRRATLASLGVVAIYVALIGAPEAAVRSAVMLGAVSISRLSQRPTSPWALLAAGAAAPLFAPNAVRDVGYQLSVVGVAALFAGGALVRRVLPQTVRGWRRTLAAGFVVSTVATVVSAPLVAWSFGRISLVGPFTNLAAAPLMGIAQPVLFLGLLLAPWPTVAALVGDAAHPLLAAFDAIALAGASIPGAWMTVAPTAAGAVLAAAASVSLVMACVSDWPGPPLVGGAVALTLLTWGGLLPTGSGDTELHMLDVGQGDAIALRTPHGHWILFDAGRAWRGGDAGRSLIVPYLSRRRGTLEAFVLSHPHADHVGGAATVIAALHPVRYYDAAFAGTADAYLESLRQSRQTGTHWSRVHPGDSLAVDGVTLRFLAPDSSWTASLSDPNLSSAIVLVRVGHVRFLLVGDAEAPEERWVLSHWPDSLAADVLKVGHHGSSTSSTATFLDAVRPRIALVSVGAGNMYGHPSASVLEALASRGAQVLRTDRLGTVIVRTDGDRLIVDANGDTWELPRSSKP
jgi:competence protein ComEC